MGVVYEVDSSHDKEVQRQTRQERRRLSLRHEEVTSFFSLGEIMKPLVNVQFLKVQCECGAVNYHPVSENRLIINEDEERRCFDCGRILSRESILNSYVQPS
jgi:hypothetical protein